MYLGQFIGQHTLANFKFPENEKIKLGATGCCYIQTIGGLEM